MLTCINQTMVNYIKLRIYYTMALIMPGLAAEHCHHVHGLNLNDVNGRQETGDPAYSRATAEILSGMNIRTDGCVYTQGLHWLFTQFLRKFGDFAAEVYRIFQKDCRGISNMWMFNAVIPLGSLVPKEELCPATWKCIAYRCKCSEVRRWYRLITLTFVVSFIKVKCSALSSKWNVQSYHQIQ